MSVTGLPGQGPVRAGIPIADLSAGGFLAQAILIALLEREVTGIGRYVHTSLLESMIAMMDFQAARWLMARQVAGQAGNNHPIAAPTGLYRTADGHILLAATGERLWSRFCDAAGAEELGADPRFATAPARLAHRDDLNAAIEAVLTTRASGAWFDIFSAAGIPCGPVNTMDKVFADPQVQQLDIVMRATDAKRGDLALISQPANIDGHAKTIRVAPADLGQHTDEVLRALGLATSDIVGLRERGVI